MIVLLGGLGLCGAASLLAPGAGTAGFAFVAGGVLAKAGEALAPNIASDLFSRMADWISGRLRDEGAAAKNHDLCALVELAIANVIDSVIVARPGGREGIAFLKRAKAAIKKRLGEVVLDPNFSELREGSVVEYFREKLDAFASVRALSEDHWRTFLNEKGRASLSIDEMEALDAAAYSLYIQLPRHLVGVFRDAMVHHPTIFVAVQTAILQEIWDAASRASEGHAELASSIVLLKQQIRQVGEAIARTHHAATQAIYTEFSNSRAEVRLLGLKIDFISQETLAQIAGMRFELSAFREGQERIEQGLSALHHEITPPIVLAASFETLSDAQVRRLPTSLVVANYGVVPFDDSRGLGADLLEWALREAGNGPSGRLYAAPGGYGKTRLALEAASTLGKAGWRAGFLAREAFERPNLRGEQDVEARLRRLFASTEGDGIFLVMDYAEGRGEHLDLIARCAIRAETGTKIRILALARGDGGWWRDLLEASRDAALVFDKETVRSIAGEIPPERRSRFAERAAEAFAERLGRADDPSAPLLDPGWRSRPIPEERVQRPEAGTPLGLAFEAFLQVRGTRGSDSPLAEMAREERRHWLRCLRYAPARSAFDGADSRLVAIERSATALVLTQGTEPASSAEAHSQTDRVLAAALRGDALGGGDDVARGRFYADVRSVVETLYLERTGGGYRLRPILPDILGEHIANAGLDAAPELMAAIVDGIPEKAHICFRVMQRVVDDGVPADGFTIALAKSLQNRTTERMALALCTAAGHGRSKFVARLAGLVPHLTEGDVRLLNACPAILLPRLAQLRTAITQKLLSQKSRSHGAESPYERVQRLGHIAISLFGEGKRDDAAEVNADALNLYSRHTEPGSVRWRLAGAGLWTNEAIFRASIGKHDGAAKAVSEAERALSTMPPDDPQVAAAWVRLWGQAAHIHRAGGNMEAAHKAGEAAARTAIVQLARPDVLSVYDVEHAAAACLNFANGLDPSSAEASHYYDAAWRTVQRIDEETRGDSFVTIAVACARHAYLHKADYAKARDIFIAATMSCRQAGGTSAYETIGKLARSIVTCMRSLGQDEEAIDAQLAALGIVQEEMSFAEERALALLNQCAELRQTLLRVPSREALQSLKQAERALDEHLRAHRDDPGVQEVARRFAEGKEPATDRAPEVMQLHEEFGQLVAAADQAQPGTADTECIRERFHALLASVDELAHLEGARELRNFLRFEKGLAERVLGLAPAPEQPDIEGLRAAVAAFDQQLEAGEAVDPLAFAGHLMDLGEACLEGGLGPESADMGARAIAVLQGLDGEGRGDVAGYLARALLLLGREASVRGDEEQASAYFLAGAEAYQAAPQSLTRWAFETLRSLVHKLIASQRELGVPQSAIDQMLADLGVVAADPQDSEAIALAHRKWLEADRDRDFEAAQSLYDEVRGALDTRIDHPGLHPLRLKVRADVERLQSSHDYGEPPRIPSAS